MIEWLPLSLLLLHQNHQGSGPGVALYCLLLQAYPQMPPPSDCGNLGNVQIDLHLLLLQSAGFLSLDHFGQGACEWQLYRPLFGEIVIFNKAFREC